MAGSGGATHPHEYRIVPERSALVVRLYKGGIASLLAHDHAVSATRFSGTVVFDTDAPSRSSVVIDVDARALVADDPHVCRDHGIVDRLPEADRREVQANMEAAGQLDVRRYPSIRFASTAVEPLSGGRLRVAGELTIHGVTRRVAFPVAAMLDAGVFRGEATLRFKQSDFGIQPYSGALGLVRNRDEVKLHIVIVAVPT